MSDQSNQSNSAQPSQNSENTYTPASPVKRVLAWVGIVYMLALVALNVYPFFTQGRYLSGVAPLLVIPGVAGLGVIALLRLRQGGSPLLRAGMLILAAACLAVMVLGAVDGIPALLGSLGGGQG